MRFGTLIKYGAACVLLGVCSAALARPANKFSGIQTYMEGWDAGVELSVPRMFRDGTATRQDVQDWRAALVRDQSDYEGNAQLEEVPGSHGRLWSIALMYARNSNYLGFIKTPTGYKYLDDERLGDSVAFVYPSSGKTYLYDAWSMGAFEFYMGLSMLENDRVVGVGLERKCEFDQQGYPLGKKADRKACRLWRAIIANGREEAHPTEGQLKQVFGF